MTKYKPVPPRPDGGRSWPASPASPAASSDRQEAVERLANALAQAWFNAELDLEDPRSLRAAMGFENLILRIEIRDERG